jgi:hypothetical protein
LSEEKDEEKAARGKLVSEVDEIVRLVIICNSIALSTETQSRQTRKGSLSAPLEYFEPISGGTL